MRCLFVISTPNISFLVNSQNDPEFRESLLLSDLCPAVGTPIVWIARLTGIPIKHRIAGFDIFETRKAWPHPGRPLKVFSIRSSRKRCRGCCPATQSHGPGYARRLDLRWLAERRRIESEDIYASECALSQNHGQDAATGTDAQSMPKSRRLNFTVPGAASRKCLSRGRCCLVSTSRRPCLTWQRNGNC
jgi:hypothetical protein